MASKTPPLYRRELDAALTAVRRVTALTESVRREWRTKTRGEDNPVTVGDLGAQYILLRELESAFPGDRVIAEEDSSSLEHFDPMALHEMLEFVGNVEDRNPPHLDYFAEVINYRGEAESERVWMIDPIDGTKGFRDSRSYVTAVALCIDNQPRMSVIGVPSISIESSPGPPWEGARVFWARQGGGAWEGALDNPDVTPKDLRRSPPGPLSCTVVPRSQSISLQEAKDALKQIGVNDFLVCDSMVKFALLARGNVSVYLRPPHTPGRGVRPWDIAPGLVICEESGATVTDLDGEKLDFTPALGPDGRLSRNRGVVVTRGRDHGVVLAVCRRQGI